MNKLPLTVTGIVEHGAGDGKKLGFPTANLKLEQGIDIPYGVYAAWTSVETIYMSVLHYGPRLVFSETTPLFEVHILDFDQDIYGKTLSVTLTNQIRETIKFDSLEALIEQMTKDVASARKLLKMI